MRPLTNNALNNNDTLHIKHYIIRTLCVYPYYPRSPVTAPIKYR